MMSMISMRREKSKLRLWEGHHHQSARKEREFGAKRNPSVDFCEKVRTYSRMNPKTVCTSFVIDLGSREDRKISTWWENQKSLKSTKKTSAVHHHPSHHTIFFTESTVLIFHRDGTLEESSQILSQHYLIKAVLSKR